MSAARLVPPGPEDFAVVARGGPARAYAAVLAAAFLAFLLLAGTPLVLYHVVMSAVLLPLVAWRQAQLAPWLARLPLPAVPRFILLAAAVVVAEEVLVGTILSLVVERDPSLWATRVRQFVTLNLLVFAGPVLALALHARLTAPHRWELPVLAGGWGLYSEAILQRLPAAPVLAGLLLWPTLVIYALIFAPATLSVAPERGNRRPPLWLRALAVWALAFAVSVPVVLAVDSLRRAQPDLFPPCALTGCAEGSGDGGKAGAPDAGPRAEPVAAP